MLTTAKLVAVLVTAVTVSAAIPVATVAADDAEGTVDGGSQATMQPLTIAVSLPAEDHDTARSWLFMIETTDGEPVAAVSVETSAAVPSSSVETDPLPSGQYRVRLMFGNHIGVACGNGLFYEVVQPPTGVRNITVGASPALTLFTFSRCADAPTDLVASIDPVATNDGPDQGPARVGTADNPLPPDTGTGLKAAAATGGAPSLGAVAGLLPALAVLAFGTRLWQARARSDINER